MQDSGIFHGHDISEGASGRWTRRRGAAATGISPPWLAIKRYQPTISLYIIYIIYKWGWDLDVLAGDVR